MEELSGLTNKEKSDDDEEDHHLFASSCIVASTATRQMDEFRFFRICSLLVAFIGVLLWAILGRTGIQSKIEGSPAATERPLLHLLHTNLLSLFQYIIIATGIVEKKSLHILAYGYSVVHALSCEQTAE